MIKFCLKLGYKLKGINPASQERKRKVLRRDEEFICLIFKNEF